MTTVNVTGIAAPTMGNLSATATKAGIKLEWDNPTESSHYITEIWRASVNVRTSATAQYYTIADWWEDTNVVAGGTYYYWIRSRSIHDRADGAWEPVSSTGGVSEQYNPNISAADLQSEEAVINGGSWRLSYDCDDRFGTSSGGGGDTRSALSTTNFSASGVSGSSGSDIVGSNDITSWSTWTPCIWSGNLSITGVDWKGFIINCTGSAEWDTPSGTTGTVELWARVNVYNYTDSVSNYTSKPICIAKLTYDGGVYHAQQNFTIMHRVIGLDAMDSGDSYRARLELYKYRSDSGTSWDVRWTQGYVDAQIDPR